MLIPIASECRSRYRIHPEISQPAIYERPLQNPCFITIADVRDTICKNSTPHQQTQQHHAEASTRDKFGISEDSQPCSWTSCGFEDGSRHYIVLLLILVALLNRLICTIQELFPRVAYGLPANLAVSGGKGQV